MEKASLRYLNYIIRHKWFVFVAGVKIGVPLHLLLFHDWSKFKPSEWRAYRNYFYRKDTEEGLRAISEFGVAEAAPYGFFQKDRFNIAWLHHQRRNKHHWQYWLLHQDDGSEFPVSMPMRYIREMVADWAGAGKAITGKWEVAAWYEENMKKIIVRCSTRLAIENILVQHFPKGGDGES